jgi:hypothetical protein
MIKTKKIVANNVYNLKRQWGFINYDKDFNERASADVGFICIVYNLKRTININKSRQH